MGNALRQNRDSRRAPTLAVQDPREWRAFRRDFMDAVAINRWDHTRARRELRMALQGPVRQLVEDIDFVPDPLPAPLVAMPAVDGVLDTIEARICPPGDSDVHRINFRHSCQEPGESVMEWLGRCRSLFARSNPEVPAEQLDGNRFIIDQFVLGLTSTYMKTRTWERRPNTLTDAGNFAVNLEAGQQVITGQAPRPGQDPRVNALQPENPHFIAAVGKTGACFFCNRTNHQLKDCRDFASFKKRYEEERGRRGQNKKSNFGQGKFSAQGSFKWRSDENGARRGGRGRGGPAGRRGGRQASAVGPADGQAEGSTNGDRAGNLLRTLDLNREATVANVGPQKDPADEAWAQYYSGNA